MKYKIEINYDTGNSFRTQRGVTDFLELEWDDLLIAKENLQRIKDHYAFHQEYEREVFTDKQDLLQKYKDKVWFVNNPMLVAYEKDKKRDYFAINKKDRKKYTSRGYIVENFIKDDASHLMKFHTDEAKPMQIYCFWCGWFERLNGAKIVCEENDMEFKIN